LCSGRAAAQNRSGSNNSARAHGRETDGHALLLQAARTAMRATAVMTSLELRSATDV
jgi:hypothetical protein